MSAGLTGAHLNQLANLWLTQMMDLRDKGYLEVLGNEALSSEWEEEREPTSDSEDKTVEQDFEV